MLRDWTGSDDQTDSQVWVEKSSANKISAIVFRMGTGFGWWVGQGQIWVDQRGVRFEVGQESPNCVGDTRSRRVRHPHLE
jgi:hypothetical protein